MRLCDKSNIRCRRQMVQGPKAVRRDEKLPAAARCLRAFGGYHDSHGQRVGRGLPGRRGDDASAGPRRVDGRRAAMRIRRIFSRQLLLRRRREKIAAVRGVVSSALLRARASAQSKLAQAKALRSSRVFLYDALSEAWDAAVAGEPLSLRQKAGVLLGMTNAVKAVS
jgi:hypothetical protein